MSSKQALGHIERYDAFGHVTEAETLTCNHCGKIFLKPGSGDPVGFCHMCFSPVCLECGKIDRCDPFEEKLKRLEQQSRLRAALG